MFKNGSVLDNLAATERSRGQRRHGGLMEECVGIDDKILREVIIPVMAVSRRAKDGTMNEKEPLNKS
nr:MAG TPA: terminase large subunit [Caudoviricetes sp.]